MSARLFDTGPLGMPATEIRGFSLTQPWATAVALGLKRIETRSFRIQFRGLLAIHGAKGCSRADREFAIREHRAGRLPALLPRSAILAVVRVADCVPTETLETGLGEVERLYGNYQPGRYAWLLEDLYTLPEPLPVARGWQGLWTLPPDLGVQLVRDWERRKA